jgi:Asp-tRNA(Asn)/Glu-tRNA(Gln) amidotransferase A subunit family amidase
MPESFQLTTAEAARLIRTKELSPVDLARSLLERLDSLEPRINAWVYLDREAVIPTLAKKRPKSNPEQSWVRCMVYPSG